MYALFEEAGKFLAGRVLSEAEASAQVELDSGKRVKVKAANILLKFEKPAPAELMAQAQAVARPSSWSWPGSSRPRANSALPTWRATISATTPRWPQQAGALFRLFEAPHYFRRAGKGRFKKAPAEILQQALAAIEKKKQVQQQIADWAAELGRRRCPEPIREQLLQDPVSPRQERARIQGRGRGLARHAHLAPLDLLQKAGAIASAYQFHWKRFLFENFPKGTGFPAAAAPPSPTTCRWPPCRRIRSTTRRPPRSTTRSRCRAWAAAPSRWASTSPRRAWPCSPAAPSTSWARQRLSTVYMPGYKITMLPDDVVQTYTCRRAATCPAVSLYVTLDEATLEIKATETRLERVPIAANLRHDQLDGLVTAEWLENPTFEHQNAPPPAPMVVREQLSFLYRLAKAPEGQREVVRGKPENFNRPDYNFRLVGNEGNVPTGNEQVQITTRQRGAPLDLIVAEAMILANSTWGSWLAELGVPGIYRSQASWRRA
jgi:exoribonuclease-2